MLEYNKCLISVMGDNWLHFVRYAFASVEIDFHRWEFRRYETVSRKDFATIEYLLRKGRRSVEMYLQPGIKDIHQ